MLLLLPFFLLEELQRLLTPSLRGGREPWAEGREREGGAILYARDMKAATGKQLCEDSAYMQNPARPWDVDKAMTRTARL